MKRKTKSTFCFIYIIQAIMGKKVTVLLAFIISASIFAGLSFANATIEPTPIDTADGYSQTCGCFISMKSGSTEALLPDGAHTLKNTPFVTNNFIYVPLRETVELFGGMVHYNSADKSVLIALPGLKSEGVFSQVWIGKSRVLNNAGEENTPNSYDYREGKLADYVPIVKNGSVFIPATYFERFRFGTVYYEAEASRVWIDNFNDGLYLAGFKLDSDFSLLDKNIRARFKSIGREEIDSGQLVQETFSDGDVELVVRTGDPKYIKNEGVKEEINRITLISDKYSSPRGLRIGDSTEKLYSLYWIPDKAANYSTGHMEVETQNGKVIRFGIFSMD